MTHVESPLSPIPFPEVVSHVLQFYQPPMCAAATRQAMVRVLGYVAGMGVTSSADLTAALVARYIAGRREAVCTNTVIGELGYLRAAVNIAYADGLIDRNPFEARSRRRLRVRPEPPADKQHHSISEVARVLAHLKDQAASWEGRRLYAVASTIAYTGLRRREAFRMHRVDVHLPQGFLDVLDRRRLKTLMSAQPVPIPPELAPILEDWVPLCASEWLFPGLRRKGPWEGGGPGYTPLARLKQAAESAGVEGFTFQSLRHSWATHAESAWEIGEGGIQRCLRHTRPMTQRRYRHPDLDNLRAIGRKVTFRPEPPSAPPA